MTVVLRGATSDVSARGRHADVAAAARTALASWTATPVSTAGPDLGPVVLTTLVDDTDTQRAAVRAWLRHSHRTAGVGLFGGMAGALAGLRLLADVHPDVTPAAERVATSLAAVRRWRDRGVGFEDYDLVSGPAGLLLGHSAGRAPVRDDHVTPIVDHLAELGADATLEALRIGAHEAHPLLAWTQGGIVTGLAHGVAGVVAALGMIPQRDLPVFELRNMCRWLVTELVIDGRGIATWPRRVDGTDCPPRQAWCYGNPGISWALWTAGQALTRAGLSDGPALCDTAEAAFRTMCDGFDPGFHLNTEPLSVCHGAAGLMLVADAFARHAELPSALALRDWLAEWLRSRLTDVLRLAESDMSLLTGASGVLAALLTAGGADRGWLRCLALS